MILDLNSLVVGSTFSDKVVYISECSVRVARNGNPFVSGTLKNKETSVAFKVWDAPVVSFFQQHSLSGHTVECTGRVGTYQDAVDITLTSCSAVDPVGYPPVLFYKSCDIHAVWEDFLQVVNSMLSAPAMEVLQRVLTTGDMLARFQQEFAGSRMHDAQVGGLASHTTKMCKLAQQVIQNEPRFATLPGGSDLLLLGVALHDIGKTQEMQLGVYTEFSFVTHRTIGIEILHTHKDFIVEKLGMHAYYILLSVVQGHHGEFGDAPTSIYAYFVHLIDMLDSQVTGIFDKLEAGDTVAGKAYTAVACNGGHLAV